ncbi:flavin monoamine oxidase family protein [Amycolatopsis circi]|uniref:flavin monoamine oxidase family protein n=1 Tax=Amycolatopsis circi TaxID=871959 RepID=UPI000E285320|nr:NAD(P)/FAD-dependent oxidoreductase [Amycolatopsis circi]
MREQQCEVVVIGAGAAGLVAGSTLAESTDVVVLESADRPGGRVESVRHGDYWLNIGTQFTEGAGPLFEVMDRYRIERGSLAGRKAALYLKGRMVTTDSPPLLLLRSRMPLAAKVELARVGLRIKYAYARLFGKNAEAARAMRTRLESRTGAEALMAGVRSREMTALFSAWSGQWIGCEPEETAATQLAISIGTALEKAAKVPNFALPVGGNQTFTDALAKDLGDRLRLGSEVRKLTWTDSSVTVEYADEDGAVRLTAKRAIVATPADCALAVMPDLPDAYRAALSDIEYGRYVLAGVFTKEQGSQRWDDYYGISTPELSFQMVFNHAAPQRVEGPRKPGGALVLLSGGAAADALSRLSDEEIEDAFLRDLVRLFPELDGEIDRVVVKRQPRVVSYWKPGKRDASQKTLRVPVGPIWFAGDYLGDPSLAAAAASGQRAARKTLQSLES